MDLHELTAQLRDFLDLPADQDYPPLRGYDIAFRTGDSAPHCRVLLDAHGSPAWADIVAWAVLTGGDVDVSAPYPGGTHPSRTQRTVRVRVVNAELPIEVVGYVDGLFQPAIDYAEACAERDVASAVNLVPVPQPVSSECLDERMATS